MGIPEKLKSAGLRTTGPRIVVLNVFRKHSRRHLTADDIYRWTADHGSTLSLATIYRVLNQLTDVGMLTRAILDGPAAHYELPADSDHDHLVCRGCGRIDEFTDPLVHKRSREIAKSNGYAISHCELALYGYCSKCRSRRRSR